MAQNHRQIWIIDHVCKKPVPVFGLLSEALFLNAKIKTLLVHLWTTPRYYISVYQVIVLVQGKFREGTSKRVPLESNSSGPSPHQFGRHKSPSRNVEKTVY